jgi:hypothetical protein
LWKDSNEKQKNITDRPSKMDGVESETKGGRHEEASQQRPVPPPPPNISTSAASPASVTSSHHRSKSAGRTTEETYSDVLSSDNWSSDGHYEVIEYDHDEYDPSHAPSPVESVFVSSGAGGGGHKSNNATTASTTAAAAMMSIQDDSPAAAALRANAEVRVSSMSKAARAVHMQSVRRALKRAAGKPRSGLRKGKPPRVPPNYATMTTNNTMSEYLLEGEEEEEGEEIVHSLASEGDESANNSLLQEIEEGEDEEAAMEQVTQRERRVLEYRDSMSIPDNVASGTVEAGKKGACSLFPFYLQMFERAFSLLNHCVVP